MFQRELFESAVAMAREALLKLGIAEREAERVEHEYRQRDAERLQAQSDTGDIRADKHRMFGADRPLADEKHLARGLVLPPRVEMGLDRGDDRFDHVPVRAARRC